MIVERIRERQVGVASSEDLCVVASSEGVGARARAYVVLAEAASSSPSTLRNSPPRVLQRSSSQIMSVSALEP